VVEERRPIQAQGSALREGPLGLIEIGGIRLLARCAVLLARRLLQATDQRFGPAAAEPLDLIRGAVIEPVAELAAMARQNRSLERAVGDRHRRAQKGLRVAHAVVDKVDSAQALSEAVVGLLLGFLDRMVRRSRQSPDQSADQVHLAVLQIGGAQLGIEAGLDRGRGRHTGIAPA
jgi:hypothetical protein